MFALRLLEALIVIGILSVVITQVATPIWFGTPWFPFFRREGWLMRQFTRTRGQIREQRLEQALMAERDVAGLDEIGHKQGAEARDESAAVPPHESDVAPETSGEDQTRSGCPTDDQGAGI